MSTNQHATSETDYIDLHGLIQNLLDKKWLIIAFGASFFTIAMLYSFVRPITYQASVILKIQNKQRNILGSNINSNASAAGLSLDEPVSIQIALIKSDYILKPVIKSLGLDIHITSDRYHFDHLFSKKSPLPLINDVQLPVKYINKPLLLMIDRKNHYQLFNKKHKLLIEGYAGITNKNGLFTIKASQINAPAGSRFILTKYPESKILTQLRSHLNITDLSGSSDGNGSKVAILQLSLVGNDAKTISTILNEIAKMTQEKNIYIKSMEAEKTLTFLTQQLPIVQFSLKQAEEKLNAYRSNSGRIDIKLQTEYLLTHISDIDKQLENIRIQYIHLSEQYTSQHPLVIALHQERYELEKQRRELSTQLSKLPASDQEAANLTRDVNVKNNLYTMLLNQIHQSQVIRAGIISDIQILTSAAIPEIMAPLKYSIVGIFSLTIGLLLGCLYVITVRIIHRRVNDPHWIEKTSHIKTIITIPYSKQQSMLSFLMHARKTQVLPLLAYQSPHDIAIESLCGLRTFLQRRIGTSKNNIISIMGVSKHSGKTFISVNLASLLARTGRKVILIDSDFRTSHMCRYFTGVETPGLTDVLLDKAQLNDVIAQSSHFDNLDFLSAGMKFNHPTDLLLGDRFKSILEILSNNYAYVIVNAAPDFSTTDNVLMGACAGINLLVIGNNMHSATDIHSAIKHLNHSGVQLDGCIFNRLHVPNSFPVSLSGNKLLKVLKKIR